MCGSVIDPVRWFRRSISWFVGFGILAGSVPGWGASGSAREATVQTIIELPGTTFPVVLADSSVRCFSGSEFALVNPGCFATSDPSQSGDCTSSASHFFVQYLFPDFAVPHRLRGFAFLSNDGDTVFPAAGALLLPLDGGSTRFPTAHELATLAVRNVRSGGDTTEVFVDLTKKDLVIEPGSPVALVLVLQFPDGGLLQAPTLGPGIAADRSLPDEGCDYFTVDAGQSGVWFEPRYDSGNPESLPLDWGFATLFDPIGVGVEDLSWSHVKQLYRSP